MRWSLFGLLGVLGCLSGQVMAVEGLPWARDLAADARTAATGRMPILVFFTSASCPYCREVERLYLHPMYARGDYRGRLLIRVVEVGGNAPLTDFAGRRTDHGEFASHERVAFMPVIRLYDAAGRELVPQLFGYTTPDFYLGYLEQAIAQAIRRVRPARTALVAPDIRVVPPALYRDVRVSREAGS